MDSVFIAVAIPIFLVAMAIEYVVSRKRKFKTYRFHDAVNSLSCGITQQVFDVFLVAWIVGGYFFIYDHIHLLDIQMSSVWAWIVILFGVDLAYYLFHRVSHRVNFVWGAHVVHHQSEDYNLSTALRQSALQGAFSAVFYWPFALIGFPPVMAITMVTLNTLYQFWIHTRVIGKLGWFEKIFNTPSHHRVHHGIDPQYIDKNYAGVFIIWDKWFGTFEEEKAPVHYGTVKPLSSWNPVYANVEFYARLLQISLQTKRWWDKLRIWWMPPEWLPEDQGGLQIVPEVDEARRTLYETPSDRRVDLYVGLQFVVILLATVAFLLIRDHVPMVQSATLSLWIILSLTAWGALFESKRWGIYLEGVRLALFAPTIPFAFQGVLGPVQLAWVIFGVALFAVFSSIVVSISASKKKSGI